MLLTTELLEKIGFKKSIGNFYDIKLVKNECGDPKVINFSLEKLFRRENTFEPWYEGLPYHNYISSVQELLSILLQLGIVIGTKQTKQEIKNAIGI